MQMDFIKYEVQASRDDVIEVTLDRQANGRLQTSAVTETAKTTATTAALSRRPRFACTLPAAATGTS